MFIIFHNNLTKLTSLNLSLIHIQMCIRDSHSLIVWDMYLEISFNNTKIIAFGEKFSARSKITVNNNILDQVSYFNFEDYNVSYVQDTHKMGTLSKYQIVCRMIQKTFQIKKRRDTKIKLYNIMSVLVLGYNILLKHRHVHQ